MTQNVVISGYGWLAGYVGNALSGKVNIIGTTRSHQKRLALKEQGVTAIEYALGDDTSVLCSHLPNATLLLNIPPVEETPTSNHLLKICCNLLMQH